MPGPAFESCCEFELEALEELLLFVELEDEEPDAPGVELLDWLLLLLFVEELELLEPELEELDDFDWFELELVLEFDFDWFDEPCEELDDGGGVGCEVDGALAMLLVGVDRKKIAQTRVPRPTTTKITNPRRTKEILRGVSWYSGGIRNSPLCMP